MILYAICNYISFIFILLLNVFCNNLSFQIQYIHQKTWKHIDQLISFIYNTCYITLLKHMEKYGIAID